MLVISIIAYCIVALYVLIISVFLIGWLRMPTYKNEHTSSTGISLIVCCKNEADNLPQLLQSITAQTHHHFEVILANDHSTDGTQQVLNDFCNAHNYAHTFCTQGTGKKNALREAIAQAHYDVIACTDADCKLQPQHLQTIANYFDEHQPDLLIGAVRMKHDGSLFQQLQALEFASLIASTAGACGAHLPIMCNGANLAFSRTAWQACHEQLHSEQLSGDDIFLLHALKQHGGKIYYLRAKEAIVDTQPQPSLRAFLAQRGRWTSKSATYTDRQTIAVALLVFATSMTILGLFIGIFWQKALLLPFSICFILKMCADFVLLSAYLPFLEQRRLIIHTLALSAVYPIYVLFSVLIGIFRKTW